MMDTQRLIALVVFSFSALLLWDAWQKHDAPKVAHPAATTIPAAPSSTPATTATSSTSSPTAPTPQSAAPQMPTASPAVPVGEPVLVHTDLYDAVISPVGGDIQKLTLQQVHSALDRAKPLTLMEPAPEHYFTIQSGLLGEGLPNHKTVYQPQQRNYSLPAGADTLEVRLKAQASNGVEVVKRVTFHRNSYVIDIAYEIANKSDHPVSPWGYFQFLRDANSPSQEAAQTSSFAGVTTFTGPALYTEESKFTKIDFKDVEKGKPIPVIKAKDGWIGIVQHYFVSAWLLKPGAEREFYSEKVDSLYRTGLKVPAGTIAPGSAATLAVQAYIGPQETERLEKAAPGLELVVDYGWLKVLAVPIFIFLKWIHAIVGNWGWSIIIVTILIKLVFYRLTAMSGRSMAKMRKLAPRMKTLQERYKDDRPALSQAMMELYKKEKVNPAAGCFPILIQMPFFFAFYWVLVESVEMRQAPFALWLQDLSAHDPFYVLPALMAAAMFFQTRMSPAPPDPVQARMMQIMPLVFAAFLVVFPAGLVLYQLTNTSLSILQQWRINKIVARESAAT